MQEYPNRFYARTSDAWGCVLLTGPAAVAVCVAWVLVCANAIEISDTGLILMVVGMVLTAVAMIFAYRVYASQWPVLKICREGLEIRSIGTTLPDAPSWDITGLVYYMLLFLLIWQFVTLRMFRTRTTRLPWADIHEMLTGKDAFTIIGCVDKPFRVSYMKYSFGVPTDSVCDAVEFFLHNPASRDSLPGWEE